MSLNHLKKSLWNSGQLKVKHSMLINEMSADSETKLKALKLTWIRRLCDNNYHPWKVIPRHYLTLPNV